MFRLTLATVLSIAVFGKPGMALGQGVGPLPEACACVDLDQDGFANLHDYALFQACFGKSGPAGTCDAAGFGCADLDASGLVNQQDYNLFVIVFQYGDATP